MQVLIQVLRFLVKDGSLWRLKAILN